MLIIRQLHLTFDTYLLKKTILSVYQLVQHCFLFTL